MPSEIDSYTNMEKIGSGGAATIYKAQDSQGRIVAVKTYHNGIGEIASKMVQQGFDLRQSYPEIPNNMLVSPHVGEPPQIAYYYIEGQTAQDSARRIREDDVVQKIQAARSLISGTMPVLEELIKRNLVHRDIQPPNLIVGEAGRISVLDYDALATVKSSKIKWGYGSPFYFSQEYANGYLSPTMDVVSLAITTGELYMDMLTNIVTGIQCDEDAPFDIIRARANGFNVSDDRTRRLLFNLARFPEEIRDTTHGIICFLLAALNSDPKARPKTAEETRQLLETTPNISMI